MGRGSEYVRASFCVRKILYSACGGLGFQALRGTWECWGGGSGGGGGPRGGLNLQGLYVALWFRVQGRWRLIG